ncbi:MAG: GntR family transcriptional regulator [Lachnospiraceae bacterium]|nr:GntR family transcriptional regulator [Lachnospiraceae bacterium]
MISFEDFLMEDDSPIYLQIIRYIKRGIAAGNIRHQEELPSRRVLSAFLGVNPNTIQKAYRVLEEEGLISSHSGAKSCIELDEAKARKVRRQLLEGDTGDWIRSMKQMGVSRQEAIGMMEQMWDL